MILLAAWFIMGGIVTILTRKQIREAVIDEFGYEDKTVLALSLIAGIIFWPLCLPALRR